MQVVPVPLKVTTVRSQKDLKPTISTLRSLSKVSPFVVNFYFAMMPCAHVSVILEYRSSRGFRAKRDDFPFLGGGVSTQPSACKRQKANTFGRFSVRAQPPGAKMAVRELRLT